MKILILGGTSFFGKELAVLLCKKERNEVTVFSRRCPIPGMPPEIRQVRGDRTVRPDLVRMSVEKWDVVIDNICFSSEDAKTAVEVFSGRMGLWVFTSSEAVYYTLKGISSPYRELHPGLLEDNEKMRSAGDFWSYAFGKKDAEKVFLDAYRDKKFPVAIARMPIVVGPCDSTLRAYSYWIRIADGGPLLLPGIEFSKRFISSRDAARTLHTLAFARSVSGEAFNFGDSVPINLREFVDLSASIMNRAAEKIPVAFEWLKEKGIKPSFSPFSGRSDTVMDLTKAEKVLNWRSSQTRDWMKDAIEWFFMKYSGPAPENYAGRKMELELAEAWIKEVRK
ncbi:MAG: NAD-dependent epimerase/dehydratase family protein [bacterium]